MVQEGLMRSASFIIVLVLAGLWKPSVHMVRLPQTAWYPSHTPFLYLGLLVLFSSKQNESLLAYESQEASWWHQVLGMIESSHFLSLKSIWISERRLSEFSCLQGELWFRLLLTSYCTNGTVLGMGKMKLCLRLGLCSHIVYNTTLEHQLIFLAVV